MLVQDDEVKEKRLLKKTELDMSEEGTTEKLEYPSLADSNLCQCCLSTKDLRSIVKPFLYRGTNEIYSDMLTMCFSKELSANEGWICSDCVGRLRATVSFRECVESAKNYLNSHLENKKHIPAIFCEPLPSTQTKTSSTEENKIKTETEYLDPHEIYFASDNEDCVDDFNDADDLPLAFKDETTHGLAAKKLAVVEKPASVERLAAESVPVPPAPKTSSKLPSGSDSSSEEDLFEQYFKPVPPPRKVFNRMEFDVSESSTLPYVLDGTDRICTICQKEFNFFQDLSNHMPEHFPNYICDICGKICATRKSFELHLQVHTNKRNQCEKCDKSFKTKEYLKVHVRSKHEGVKQSFKCHECGEALSTYSRRLAHMAEKHGREAKQYKCQQCPSRFTMTAHLSTHIRRFHLKEKKHTCQECGSSFFTKNCLEQHSAKHTGVRKYACHVCTKTYKTNYGLSVHRKKTHEASGQTSEQFYENGF